MEKPFVVVFGGAFNPITNAHLDLANQVISEYSIVKKVIFLPVGDLYQKTDLVPSEHRVNMLKRACAMNSTFFEVSEIETLSPIPLKTIDSLQLIAKKHLSYQVSFLMGTDNLEDLPSWNNAEELLHKFYFFVASRQNQNPLSIIQKHPLLKTYSDKIRFVKSIKNSFSSATMIRNLLKAGRYPGGLLPPAVYDYIQQNNLYYIGA